MRGYRPPSWKSKYYIESNLYHLSINFARMYGAWKKELAGEIEEDRQQDLSRRIEIIETAAEAAAPDDVLRRYLIQAATGGMTYEEIKGRGIPCERKTYYRARKIFFWEISRKIK